jgi:hypothetical protein
MCIEGRAENMNSKEKTRFAAAAGLAGILFVHWVPKRFLPFGSPLAASVCIIGTLLFAHRHPLKSLKRDMAKYLGELRDEPDDVVDESASS